MKLISDDRHRWRSAQSLTDLGELMALWLEGGLESRPGYAPGPPDRETTPLIPVLAACNRAGFLTDNSQPAVDPGYPSLRAWVVGFAHASVADELCELFRGTPIEVEVSVTQRRWFGRLRGPALDASEVEFIFSGCSNAAVDDVLAARQVSLTDPEPGRDGWLWPLLAKWAAVRLG